MSNYDPRTGQWGEPIGSATARPEPVHDTNRDDHNHGTRHRSLGDLGARTEIGHTPHNAPYAYSRQRRGASWFSIVVLGVVGLVIFGGATVLISHWGLSFRDSSGASGAHATIVTSIASSKLHVQATSTLSMFAANPTMNAASSVSVLSSPTPTVGLASHTLVHQASQTTATPLRPSPVPSTKVANTADPASHTPVHQASQATATRIRPSPVPSTKVAERSAIPADRRYASSSVVLLQNGRGLTTGARMSNGNFQVEGYCLNKRASVDKYDWYCRETGYRLNIYDFDAICQRTYGVSDAFAIQNGNGSQPSYQWRCYGPKSSTVITGSTGKGKESSADRLCSLSPPPRLQMGMVGYVIPSEGASNLNKYPRRSKNNNAIVDIIRPGQEFTVINGPKCGDGFTWWQVRYHKNDFIGWIAEGEGNTYWLASR